jgi:hypothetical protein
MIRLYAVIALGGFGSYGQDLLLSLVIDLGNSACLSKSSGRGIAGGPCSDGASEPKHVMDCRTFLEGAA